MSRNHGQGNNGGWNNWSPCHQQDQTTNWLQALYKMPNERWVVYRQEDNILWRPCLGRPTTRWPWERGLDQHHHQSCHAGLVQEGVCSQNEIDQQMHTRHDGERISDDKVSIWTRMKTIQCKLWKSAQQRVKRTLAGMTVHVLCAWRLIVTDACSQPEINVKPLANMSSSHYQGPCLQVLGNIYHPQTKASWCLYLKSCPSKEEVKVMNSQRTFKLRLIQDCDCRRCHGSGADNGRIHPGPRPVPTWLITYSPYRTAVPETMINCIWSLTVMMFPLCWRRPHVRNARAYTM